MLSIRDIIQITEAQVEQLASPDDQIYHLQLDSRKLAFPQQALFFAIQGQRHDGHQFLDELYQRGLRNFIVESRAFSLDNYPQANFLWVKSSVEALQKIAGFHRRQFTFPVVGITGSNGKTIVKEWLSQLLAPSFRMVRSPRSYNSQVGVPLSLWRMEPQHELGIFEAGISQPDEMEKLANIIQPTLGIFTNIGSAHDEGFTHRAQKIQEKLLLFRESQHLIYCRDHEEIHQEVLAFQQKHPALQTLTWSYHQPATLEVKEVYENQEGTSLIWHYQGKQYSSQIPFRDEASLENLLHCLVAGLHIGLLPHEINQQMLRLHPVSMRLELKPGINDCLLIDDSYNNDLGGLEIALDFLKSQKQKERKIVVLSDILESGLSEEVLYQKVARLLKEKKVDGLIGIGKNISSHAHLFDLQSLFFEDAPTLLKERALFQPDSFWFSQALLLVKGARIFAFEQIIRHLEQKTHGTILEINLNALVHNLNFFRSQLKPKTKLMAMVKAFAYGSGSAEVASLLQFHRVDYLAVAYADEGVYLRENGIHIPIMVLNPSQETFVQLFQYDLEPELYSFRILKEYISFYQTYTQKKPKKHWAIHLKIDTGMHRLGFAPNEIRKLADYLQEHLPPKVLVASVFSHLAGADEAAHEDYSRQQIEEFQQIAQTLEKALGYSVIKHILNSPGILRFPEAHLDMVRLGIGLYGIEANGWAQDHLELVGTLKTSISQIKHVESGATIGYSRMGKAHKPMRIATIAIGYADGFPRKLSNGQGEVWVNGKKVPVVGNVCMDMAMIDISHVEAEEGDEVIIFGQEYSIFELARRLETIPYEVLTNVGERVKRVFYTE